MFKSISSIKLDARTHVRMNMGRVFMTAAAYLLLSYILTYLYSELLGYTEYLQKYMEMAMAGEFSEMAMPQVKPTASILAALILILTDALNYGYQGYCLMRARGMNAGFGQVIPSVRNIFRIIVITLLMGLIVGLGFILIVPGVILLYGFRLSIFVMFDNPGMGPWACMKESLRLMKGNKWRLFKMDISFIGWTLLSALISSLFLPILDIWLMPYRGLANAMFYNELVGSGSYGMEDSPSEPA